MDQRPGLGGRGGFLDLEPGRKGLPQAFFLLLVSNVRIRGQFALVRPAGTDEGFVRRSLQGDLGSQFLIYTRRKCRRAGGRSPIASGLVRLGYSCVDRNGAREGK